jgi:hypothetical protein
MAAKIYSREAGAIQFSHGSVPALAPALTGLFRATVGFPRSANASYPGRCLTSGWPTATPAAQSASSYAPSPIQVGSALLGPRSAEKSIFAVETQSAFMADTSDSTEAFIGTLPSRGLFYNLW